MAKYAQLCDEVDPVILIDEQDLIQADAWLDAQLKVRGIDPALVDPIATGTPVHPLLNKLALHYALVLAATKDQADAGGIMPEKIRHYRELIRDELAALGRDALGLESATGFGVLTLGRA